MNIVEQNKNTIMTLVYNYPNLSGLEINGNFLSYNGESVDISEFNIMDLVNSDSDFSSSMDLLTAEDAFRIIRLHAIFLGSNKTKEETVDNVNNVEVIKEINPLMSNVSLVSRNNDGIQEQMLNVVDSMGQDHLFSIDRTFDVFGVYTDLSARYGRKEITPDEFVNEIRRKLPEIRLDDGRSLGERSEVSEDFKNKVNIQNEKYMSNSSATVTGNEQADVVVVGDQYGKHEVITYDRDEQGNLISNTHGQNLKSEMTSVTNNGETVESSSMNSVGEDEEATLTDSENGKENKEANLITFEKYKELVNTPAQFDEVDKRDVELFYAYMGELMLYENYLMEELRNLLQKFRDFITELEIQQNEMELNDHQSEAVKKYEELVFQANNNKDKDMSMVQEDVKKLKLIYDGSNNNQQGFMSTSQIIAFIIFWSLIITLIALIII